MAKNLGYYITDDEGYFGNKPSNDFSDRDYSLNTVSRVDQNMLGFDNFGKQDLGLDKINDYKLEPSEESEGMSTKQALSVGEGMLKILGGYMQADAIRKQANYQADILQLNADLALFEAGEQRGVDFSKIIRRSQEIDETVGNIRAQFTNLEQEGGAAEDVIKENNLQGQLNLIAMRNEAQAGVSSAEFRRRLAYLKSQNMREIADAQGRQAVAAGYISAAGDFLNAYAMGSSGGTGGTGGAG